MRTESIRYKDNKMPPVKTEQMARRSETLWWENLSEKQQARRQHVLAEKAPLTRY